MGTYNVPRNVKGEGRILFIFSTKAMLYTLAGVVVGLPFYFIFNVLNMMIIGMIFCVFFGIVGFGIATFKVPNSNAFKITKSAGGENIDDVIIRYIKFKLGKKKIYTYKNIENSKEENIETKEDKNG